MPFAHVVGGDGWGFHIDTSRRVWFDVGAREPDVAVGRGETVDRSDGAVASACVTANPRPCSAGSSNSRAPGADPEWVFGSGRAATSGTPRSASCGRWTRTSAERHPGRLRRDRGVERRVDVHGVPDDAQYEAPEDGAPHRLADFTFPADGAWPDPKGMVDEAPRHGRSGPPLADPADRDRAQGSTGSRPRTAGRGRARPRRPRGGRYARTAIAAGGSRSRSCPTSPTTAPRAGGPRSAATSSTRSASTGSRPTAASTRGGRSSCYLDGSRGDETNNRFPVLYAAAYDELLEATGTDGVTFSRAGLHGAGSSRRVLGGRRELDVGRVPLVDHRRTVPPARAGSSTGAGTSPASRARSRRPSSTARSAAIGVRADHAVPLRVQPPPHARRVTARRGTSPSGPATSGLPVFRSSPSCASGSSATSWRRPARVANDRCR